MTRRHVDARGPQARARVDQSALSEIEAVIATWPGDEARIGLLVIGSWLVGDTATLRRAWLRLNAYQIGWLAQVMKEIDPGLPTS